MLLQQAQWLSGNSEPGKLLLGTQSPVNFYILIVRRKILMKRNIFRVNYSFRESY